MKKVGRKTPVWRNKQTGVIAVGTTIQDALGVGSFMPVTGPWEQAKKLDPEDRVVICEGRTLPRNQIVTEIAKEAKEKGELKISAYGRNYTYMVEYADDLRVVVAP